MTVLKEIRSEGVHISRMLTGHHALAWGTAALRGGSHQQIPHRRYLVDPLPELTSVIAALATG